MKRWLYPCLFLLMMLTACTSIHETPLSDESPTFISSHDNTPRAGVAPPESAVNFFDTSTFDQRLSSDLRADPRSVDVHFRAPASVNNIPDRLGKWLTMVEKYGGTVEAREDPDYQTRSFITSGVSVAFGAFATLYQVVRNRLLYRPVKAYNATVFYKPDDGTMTRIVFARKVPNS